MAPNAEAFPPLAHVANLAANPSRPPVQTAWALFAIVAVLLATFVLVVALIAVLRQWRRARPSSATDTPGPEPPPVDAWEEAGRRTKPYPRRRR